MSIRAKVILDSISPHGCRITTMELVYPRFIHAELMTHRTFSRNVASNRAIPTARLAELVMDDPVMPLVAGANRPGMQPGVELGRWRRAAVRGSWFVFAAMSTLQSRWLAYLGLHKQWANRWMEPAQYITTLVTATTWDNFLFQRLHIDAQIEMRVLAEQVRDCLEDSVPRKVPPGYWHLPFITPEDMIEADRRGDIDHRDLRLVSAARCARVSYLNHRGVRDLDDDIRLAGKLLQRGYPGAPRHLSPFEHVALCRDDSEPRANFHGWSQLRGMV